MASYRFHEVVKNALIKDGWNITHDILEIKVGGVDMEIDARSGTVTSASNGELKKLLLKSKVF